MVTIWVKSGSTSRPRRTHRIRPGRFKTECGLSAWHMKPVTTAKIKDGGSTPPKFCNICFEYRFLSRPRRGWRRQMERFHW